MMNLTKILVYELFGGRWALPNRLARSVPQQAPLIEADTGDR
ncbi:hypothetical protein [Scytonema sp. UIC 10036]|nr:hypothetical protein [Scytonema sp. UIC 10036]